MVGEWYTWLVGPIAASIAPFTDPPSKVVAGCQAYGYGGYGKCSDTPLPKPSSPNFQAPPAPQTPAKMLTWSPDDLYESIMQRFQQYNIDSQPQKGGVITGPAAKDDGSNTMLWLIVGGVGAIAALSLIRRI